MIEVSLFPKKEIGRWVVGIYLDGGFKCFLCSSLLGESWGRFPI